MKPVTALDKTTFCGRRFTRQQLALVQETVGMFPNLSRNELAHTVCVNLDWKTPKGSYKISSALRLLNELETKGVVRLPAKRKRRAQVPSKIERQQAESAIECSLPKLGTISLQPATTAEERALWKSYVDSHHYLGYKHPIGFHILYFVVSEALQRKVGCISFSATMAWDLPARDEWIGWDDAHKKKLRHFVLLQNRFLIFPWVKVANLASHVLSLATKQVGNDWVRMHGYRPVLLETFVDKAKFSAACYKAANWHCVGETQSKRRGSKCDQEQAGKAIFVYPLQDHWRQSLTEGHQEKTLKRRYRNDVASSRSRFVGDDFVCVWAKVADILQNVAHEYDAKWQLRKRVLNTMLIMLLVFRLVTSKNSQSYGTTIDELWDSCRKLNIQLPQDASVASSSFCVARSKLDESVFKCANQRILAAYAHEAKNDTWLGHRLFAVDGTKLNLPRKFVNYGYETPSKTSHYPQGLVSCLFQLKSQLPYDFDLVSHADERICATDHFNVLQPNDVVVYDRGYFSYVMLHRHSQAGVQAVFRLQANSGKVIQAFMEGSQTDTEVEFMPSLTTQADIRKKYPELIFVPLKLRLVRYEFGGTTYYLGTTLFDRGRYPLPELADVYHARWGVEELYKISKEHFDIEDFHAKTERGVKQEIYAHFVLVTMNRLFANEADRVLNDGDSSSTPANQCDSESSLSPNSPVARIQTNFKNCIRVLERGLEEILLVRDHLAAAARRIFDSVVRRHQRQRPGRSYPRKSLRPKSKWQPNDRKQRQKAKIAALATQAIQTKVVNANA